MSFVFKTFSPSFLRFICQWKMMISTPFSLKPGNQQSAIIKFPKIKLSIFCLVLQEMKFLFASKVTFIYIYIFENVTDLKSDWVSYFLRLLSARFSFRHSIMRELSVLGHKQVGVAKSILVARVLNPTTLVAVPDSVQLSISFTSSSGISLLFCRSLFFLVSK